MVQVNRQIKAPEGAFCYFLALALGFALAFVFGTGRGGAGGFLLLGLGFLTLARALPSVTLPAGSCAISFNAVFSLSNKAP